jgi:predicted flap endonuclease-1-like 5' DNA nuclease
MTDHSLSAVGNALGAAPWLMWSHTLQLWTRPWAQLSQGLEASVNRLPELPATTTGLAFWSQPLAAWETALATARNATLDGMHTWAPAMGSALKLAQPANVAAVALKVVHAAPAVVSQEPSSLTLAEVSQAPRQYDKRPTEVDTLRHIYGVGPALEKLLHRHGVFQFRQVARWTANDIAYFDELLKKFPGRIERDNWVRSATEEHYKKYGAWLGKGKPAITLPETDR